MMNAFAAIEGIGFEQAKRIRDGFELEVRVAGRVLTNITSERLANGLTPDHVKQTQQWKDAYASQQVSFGRLAAYNAWFVRKFKKELAAERRNKGAV